MPPKPKRQLTLAQKIAFVAPYTGVTKPSEQIIPYHARMGVRAFSEKKK